MIHALKIEPQYYEAVKTGKKPFEVRKNDREFAVGDYLALNEYNAEEQKHTGRAVLAKVLYILDDEQYTPPGFVVMGIRVVQIDDNEFPFNYATHTKQEVTRE